MFNQEKAVEAIYQELAKLDFTHALIVQASLSEHIFHRWQHAQIMKEKELEAVKGDGNLEKPATALSH